MSYSSTNDISYKVVTHVKRKEGPSSELYEANYIANKAVEAGGV